jgi:tetratricopeptide (TPR) repeat protein
VPALVAAAFFVGVCETPLAGSATTDSATELSTASELLENSRPEEALGLLDKWLKKRPKDPRALLLRSSAHFMIGNLNDGKRDLNRSIESDPTNRQAWINRAALELADEDYPGALESLGRAEMLDGSAADNSLNIGAVLLLLNRFEEAADRFKDYLARSPGNAEARYLVASNYAMRGFAQPAIVNLRRAIALDERVRRKARTDPNFAPLNESSAYQDLLNTDTFQYARGTEVTKQTYDSPYLAAQSPVLDAVISSLQLAGQSFDPQVEVAPKWALIWGDMRIKVSDDGAGGTLLELSAPPGRFSAGQWQALSERLLRGVTVQLHTRDRRGAG